MTRPADYPARVVANSIEWEALARHEAHWLRISLLEILLIDNGRILSPNEMAFELQLPLSNISYHVTELAKAGFIDLAGTEQRRGATEHYYRLCRPRG